MSITAPTPTTAPPGSLARADCEARGVAARQAAPRGSHAVHRPAGDRPDPVVLLESQATSRVAELVPIRYGRMLASPFAFLRGAALIMASDLARTPQSGLRAQVCGDAHLSNFGLFASPERQLVFDVNDFDETLPGPWEWDVKRLATSIEVAGRQNGLSAAQRRDAVLGATRKYREVMADFAAMTNLEVWYAHVSLERLAASPPASMASSPKALKQAEKAVTGARGHDHLQAANKLTRMVNGEPRFISDPPLLVPLGDLLTAAVSEQLEGQLRHAVGGYRASLPADRRVLLEGYRLVDAARKVVGVGSVGTRCWVVLMVGHDDNDVILLQLKEAQASVLERFVGESRYHSAGQRVVAGQRLMQAVSDILLGWQQLSVDGAVRDFYVRQLHDWKGSVAVDQMTAAEMTDYGEACAWTLARAHARSGDRIALAAYLGRGDSFDRALADFAVAYAEQNERDFAALGAAAARGQIVAETGI